MAEIRLRQSGNPISQFQQVAPQGGLGLSVLAEAMSTAYQFLAPAATQAMENAGDDVGREMARRQMGQPRTTTMAATASSMGGVAGPAPWLREANQGATRNKPLSPRLTKALSFLGDLGVTAEVFSGGQPGINEGGARVGSTRHDHGDAADVFFYKDGRRLDWSNPDDVPLFQEIVRRGRGAGLSGFGAGPGYMQQGSMHIGFGAPAVWGADGKGENAPEWLRAAFSGAPAGQTETMSSRSPEVTIQRSDGKIEGRLYSPLSGPILQAHNAAAQAAYVSGVLNASATELLNISNQHMLDPDGFAAAAEGYIDGILEKAPDQFMRPLRRELEQMVARRTLGIAEDHQSDIRQRSANETGALMSRYSDELAEAIASNSEEAVAEASSKLDEVLRTREALPGLSWTPAQSENIRLGAAKSAAELMRRRETEFRSEIKGQLSTVVEAAKAGMSSAYDNLVGDPVVQGLLPDEWAKAAGWRAFADAIPGFRAGLPAERSAAVAGLNEMPVTESWQVEMRNAATTANKEVTAAWDRNPMDAATSYLPDKPPSLAAADDQSFVTSLAARREYANSVTAEGYTDTPGYFTTEEQQTLGAALSKTSPPEVRLAVAAGIVAGMGDDAARAMRELSSADPVTRFAGMLMARGGDPNVAVEALRGQALMDAGQVQLPRNASRMQDFDPVAADALMALPGADAAMRETMEFAKAIYAARSQGVTQTSDEEKTMMQEAVQTALGQTEDRRGRKVGGVQEIGGQPLLLPVGVAGEDVTAALQAATGAPKTGFQRMLSDAVGGWVAPKPEIWISASEQEGRPGSVPYVRGEPMPPWVFTGGHLRFIPAGRNLYRMEMDTGGQRTPVEGADGLTMFVDLERMIEASK